MERGILSGVAKSPSPETDRRIVIIDGANSIYRAFFAIPHLEAPDKTPTNAVMGFATMLGKIIREESPSCIIVAFDPRGGSFRRRIFPEYKANREAQPEDLSRQIPLVRELIEAFQIPVLEVEDFEADDVIATLVETAPKSAHISIVSTDKDLMQLVSDRVELVDHVKNRRFGPPQVQERFGVLPEKLLDVRSLVGDPSDNIPGVKGIGEKGAAKLITEWGSLENLLDHAEEVKAKKAREALLSQRAEAELSKELSTLRVDVELSAVWDDLSWPGSDLPKLRAFYEKMGFVRLVASLQEAKTEGSSESEAHPVEVQVLSDVEEFEKALRMVCKENSNNAAIYFLLSEGNAVDSEAVGLGLATGDLSAVYIPITGSGLEAGRPGVSPAEIARVLTDFVSGSEPSVETGSPGWISVNTKQVQDIFLNLDLRLAIPSDDIGIAGFLLDPSSSQDLSRMASAYLGRSVETWEELVGRGAKAVAAEALPVDRAAAWVSGQVCAISALAPVLRAKLETDGLLDVYESLELPLTGVLAGMESEGVRVDEQTLKTLSVEYQGKLDLLETEIYQLAGEEFLITSTKQLQVILFEKLGLPILKKTKTGYSTSEGVLEQLREHHELPSRILAYRKLSKLMSTYISALPRLISAASGRIHPSFNQLGAATGRMSASNPNVQNIPIRGEDGARIREAFVPSEGRVMLSADYSQVELRILAHYARDETLVRAFQEEDDVHRLTASEVWGVKPEEVTSEQRARAKAVNFGIIYGSSAFGLANQLDIATEEAQQTIDAYFDRYQGVRKFIDETIASSKETGFVSTFLGRRRYLPDLRSRNRTLRQAAERVAVNSVIQGTAADLIKRSMIQISDRLAHEALPAVMILQVHDELVFEVEVGSAESLSRLVIEEMESALEFRVPLVVEVGQGSNWREAH